jgi:hypothetical protein
VGAGDERPLDPVPLVLQQLACALGVHAGIVRPLLPDRP